MQGTQNIWTDTSILHLDLQPWNLQAVLCKLVEITPTVDEDIVVYSGVANVTVYTPPISVDNAQNNPWKVFFFWLSYTS